MNILKKIKCIFNIFLLLTFISFSTQIYAVGSDIIIKSAKCPRVTPEVIKKLDKISKADYLFDIQIQDIPTFDEVFQLMESFLFNDEEELEDLYTLEELDIINAYLIKMVRIGVQPGNKEKLEKDIAELLSDDDDDDDYKDENDDEYNISQYENEKRYSFSSKNLDENNCITTLRTDHQTNIVLCFNPVKVTKKAAKKTTKAIKKGVKKTGKFIKENAKTIAIIATTVVVGVTVYYVISSKSSEASCPEDSFDESIKEEKENSFVTNENVNPDHYQDLPSNHIENEKLIKAEVLEDKMILFKTDAEENNDFYVSEKNKNLWDNTKEVLKETSAYATHKILEEVSDYAKVVPELIDEIGDVGSRFKPDALLDDMTDNPLIENPEKTIVENYEQKISKGHQIIDQVFDVNQSQNFTKDAKEAREKDFSIAILPPPGGLLKESLDFKKLADAGKVYDRAGLTKAGRALAKHGGRENSVFPKPKGNAMEINQLGQLILESVLNDPNKIIIYQNLPKFGDVIDIKIQGKYGVRYYKNGDFIGFLEP